MCTLIKFLEMKIIVTLFKPHCDPAAGGACVSRQLFPL